MPLVINSLGGVHTHTQHTHILMIHTGSILRNQVVQAVSCYFNCNSCLKQLYISNKMEWFSYKGEWGMTCIKEFKERAGLEYVLKALGY